MLFLPDFENTALREVFALFQMLRSSSARVVSHFGFVQKTRRFSARYSVVLFWLRLGPKIEKRGLRGVFRTLGNNVFCDSPLGVFCVFLSLPFSLICSACSLGGGGVGGGLTDVLFRGQAYAAIIKSTTRGKEHATNETTAGGGRGAGTRSLALLGQPTSGSPSNHHHANLITKQPSPCKHHHQATITMPSPCKHHHQATITMNKVTKHTIENPCQ